MFCDIFFLGDYMFELCMKILSSPLYWGFIIICIFVYIYSSKILGFFGELWTKQELNKLPKDTYKIINDVLIKIGEKTYQIDHIVVSLYGIFVIETKQYNGYITGNKYDKKWVRNFGKKTYYYTNPIRQNYGHVKAISELLNIDESLLYNIVCVPSMAKLKIEHDGELVRNYNILCKIFSYQDVVFYNIDEIVDIINKNNIKDKKIRKEHIKNIRKNLVNNNINECPKCGYPLEEKNGKYGKFIGCSNYPHCKYTRKI